MKPIVLTIGTFDVPHIAHARLFQRCEQLGHVVVGVNSDAFVLQYKRRACIFSQDERMALIEELGYEVELNDGPGIDLIDRIRPDYLVIGSDWLSKDYLKQIGVSVQFLEERDISLVYVRYTPGISTTIIKERLQND